MSNHSPYASGFTRLSRLASALCAVSLLSVVSPIPSRAQEPTGANMLANPDFSRGTQGWRLEVVKPAAASVEIQDVHTAPPEVAGRVASFNVAETGTERWHVQFYQAGLDFVEGEPYTLVFWARADRPRPISIGANVDLEDAHGIGLNVDGISITPKWRKYTYTFTPTAVVKGRCRITFILGEGRGPVSLTGLTLRRGKPTQEVGPNLIVDGQFGQSPGVWRLENRPPAEGSITMVGGAAAPAGINSRVAHLEVKKTTDVNWHVQFMQDSLDLLQAETYTLSFWARADHVRPIMVTTTLDRPDWHWVGPAPKFTLTTEWKKYSATYTVAHTVKSHSRISFLLGDELGTIDIADVSLRREGIRTAASEATGKEAVHPLVGTWESGGASASEKLVFTFNADGTGSIRSGAELVNTQGAPRTRVANAFRWFVKTPDARTVMIGNEQYKWMIAGSGAAQRLTLIDSKNKTHTLLKR